MIGTLEITVTNTADGKHKYVQIASPAAMPVNIVLVCDDVVVRHMDSRQPGKTIAESASGWPKPDPPRQARRRR